MIADDDLRHGTPQGYQRCVQRPAGACDPCRWARALYQEVFRWDKGDALRARENHQTARRSRALTILAHRHSDELEQIVLDLIRTEQRPTSTPLGY